MKPDHSIPLGGRNFAPLGESTIEHDFYMLARLRRGGLDALVLTPDEVAEPDRASARILVEAFESGVAYDLFGGLLVPEGTAPEAWTALQGVFASAVIGFFRAGLVSLRTFRSSSESETGPADQPASRPAESAERSASASGGSSSGP
jgi:hypothetical protein